MGYAEHKNLLMQEQAVEIIRSTVIDVSPWRISRGSLASCAASCLIQPRLGDTVLCMVAEGQAVILSVIERSEPELPSVIDSSAAIEIRSPQISFLSQTVDIHADQMTVNVGVLKRIADRVDEVLQYFSSSIETMFVHAKRSIKRVDELDETRAGHLRLESPSLVEVNGAVTIVSAEKLVKLQADQIHMG